MRDKQQLELMLQLTQDVLTDAVHVLGQHNSGIPDSILYCWGKPASQFIDDDMVYIRNRAQKEGVSFFTKSLPLLGKRIDAFLTGSDFDGRGFYNRRTGTSLFGWLLRRDIGEPYTEQSAKDLCPISCRLVRDRKSVV